MAESDVLIWFALAALVRSSLWFDSQPPGLFLCEVCLFSLSLPVVSLQARV